MFSRSGTGYRGCTGIGGGVGVGVGIGVGVSQGSQQISDESDRVPLLRARVQKA